MRAVSGIGLLALVATEKVEDLITTLPGFENVTWDFKAYSGMLDVPGPINGYDSLRIHYQFHTSMNTPATDPVATWHNGGPGSSSINIGLYGELGAFRVGEESNYINPWAWNNAANMLYLDSPAGSGNDRGYPGYYPESKTGYSECIQGGEPVDCKWDDVSQGEAYAHTLQAFFTEFPEFADNDLYMTGESYFGQYGPNIAHYIVNNEPFSSSLNLKGIAVGNACWGGNETLVACVGPSEDRIDVELFSGKALISPKLKEQIDETCEWPTEYSTGDATDPDGVAGHALLSDACKSLLDEMERQVGPFDVYDIYDNCPQTDDFLRKTGKSRRWLKSQLRKGLHNPAATRSKLKAMNGGFDWDCLGSAEDWITSPAVREALHLGEPGRSFFDYESTGPASVTLYPELVKKLRVLYYSGDADACVPYIGYEEMLGSFEDQGVLEETKAWSPWFTSNKAAPAGYITEYSAPGGEGHDVSFATVRLSGHMVPQFTPEAGFELFRNWITGGHAAEKMLV